MTIARAASTDEQMIKPVDVPRLPLLDWDSFGSSGRRGLPSILDGSDYVYTSSGRAAILIGLEAVGVGKGDRVMVPTYHCPTMVAPIIALEAIPVFYPVDARGRPCLNFVENEAARGVRAILVPHYFGLPQNFTALRALCDRHGIAFIEDCAHSFFGSADGIPVGHTGDVAIASLTKFFPVPGGGILASARGRPLLSEPLTAPGPMQELKALIDMLETAVGFGRLWGLSGLLRQVFALKKSLLHRAESPAAAPKFSESVVPEALDFNVKLARQSSELACQLAARMSKRAKIVTRRRANYRRLAEALSGYEGFSPLFPALPDGAVPYVFPLSVKNPEAKYRRLKELGLPVFRWNWLWPGTPSIDGDCGQRWSSEIFQLTCHQDLRDEELACIERTIVEVCKERGDGRP